MKNKKPLNFIIPLVVYPFDIMVSFCETNEQIDKHLKKYNLTPDDVENATFGSSTVVGRTINFVGNQTLIKMKEFPVTDIQKGMLAHEIFHAVSFVMYKIGMPLKIKKSDEAYAYLIGYLTTEIYKRLK